MSAESSPTRGRVNQHVNPLMAQPTRIRKLGIAPRMDNAPGPDWIWGIPRKLRKAKNNVLKATNVQSTDLRFRFMCLTIEVSHGGQR